MTRSVFGTQQRTINIWQIELQCSDATVASLTSVLSDDERQRAARFVFPRDRRRFIVTRASLRVLLAGCCGAGPTAIRLTYSEYGKPSLASDSAAPAVHFNVSHAGDVALIALTPDGPLGVDIEEVRPVPDLLSIASRFFTAGESEMIRSTSPEERDLVFFACWTRKEAFAKAIGYGLSLWRDRYQVVYQPGALARIPDIDGSGGAAASWSMYDLMPAPRFVGAIAMRGSPRRVELRRLDVRADILPRLHQ